MSNITTRAARPKERLVQGKFTITVDEFDTEFRYESDEGFNGKHKAVTVFDTGAILRAILKVARSGGPRNDR